jgi:hypothetical protein
MAAGAMTPRPAVRQALGRKVTMTRVTFGNGQEEGCSICLNDMNEGVRCELPGKFFLVCKTCVTAMGIVVG